MTDIEVSVIFPQPGSPPRAGPQNRLAWNKHIVGAIRHVLEKKMNKVRKEGQTNLERTEVKNCKKKNKKDRHHSFIHSFSHSFTQLGTYYVPDWSLSGERTHRGMGIDI